MVNFLVPGRYDGRKAGRLLTIAIGCMLCSAGCDAASSAEQANQASGAALPIGTNLDSLSYWSPAFPVLDQMKSASKWIPQNDATFDTGEPIDLDAEGWVRSLPAPGKARFTRVIVNVLHDNPAAPSRARYVVLYDGKGSISAIETAGSQNLRRSDGRLTVSAGDGGSLFLQITETDLQHSGDYIRNIRVVREDQLAAYETGQVFNPAFVAKLEGFAAIRFMDWMQTNQLTDKSGRAFPSDAGAGAAGQIDWADRPLPADMRWGESARGMPVEAMVAFANRIGADPWFNMPVNASDDYVRGFASYVRDHLRPELKVHVEYSNEVWNWMFPQSHYAQARAREAFGPDGNWMAWYAKRAAEVGAIWNETFGEPVTGNGDPGRVSIVYNTQFAWKGLETHGLDFQPQGAPAPLSAWFDDYAITGYYDGTMNTDELAPAVIGSWRDGDGGYGRAIEGLRNRITTFNAPLYAYHAAEAKKRGMRLVTYESGFGEYTPYAQHDNEAYTDFLAKLQRQPAFYDLEMANYRAFRDAGGTLYMNFGIISTPGKWGNWSSLESLNQPTSPRYRALKDWIAANGKVPANAGR